MDQTKIVDYFGPQVSTHLVLTRAQFYLHMVFDPTNTKTVRPTRPPVVNNHPLMLQFIRGSRHK